MSEKLKQLLDLASRLPEGLRADWDGTNHYEMTAPTDDGGYFWLTLDEIIDSEAFYDDPSSIRCGQRLGLLMDIAEALKEAEPELQRQGKETLRGSGRTTRMLEHAAELAKEGRAVYVVLASEGHRKIVEKMFKSMHGEDTLGVKFEVADMLPELDWNTLTFRGAHPNTVVLVDHFVIERRYSHILDMLHRYDP